MQFGLALAGFHVDVYFHLFNVVDMFTDWSVEVKYESLCHNFLFFRTVNHSLAAPPLAVLLLPVQDRRQALLLPLQVLGLLRG